MRDVVAAEELKVSAQRRRTAIARAELCIAQPSRVSQTASATSRLEAPAAGDARQRAKHYFAAAPGNFANIRSMASCVLALAWSEVFGSALDAVPRQMARLDLASNMSTTSVPTV